MRVLVTGSAGHLGDALMRTLRAPEYDAIGLHIQPSPHTRHVGSITDRRFVDRCVQGVAAVLHTATLHKPQIASHTCPQIIDTHVTGTLTLLEAAVVECVPKNIYGLTKFAAEQLCELFHRQSGLPCIVLRTSRFFPESDDDPEARRAFHDDNLKVNELLCRRVDIEDVVSAHLLAMTTAPSIGFGRYIISATSPFTPDDLRELRSDAPSVVTRRLPGYAGEYVRRGWSMTPAIDRVSSTNAHEPTWGGDLATTLPTRSSGWRPGKTIAARWRKPWVPRAIIGTTADRPC